MSLYSRIVRASDSKPTKPAEKVVETKSVAPPQAPSKAKRGRPKTDFDKAEYNRQYMRDLRTIKRQGLNITVKQWREKDGKD